MPYNERSKEDPNTKKKKKKKKKEEKNNLLEKKPKQTQNEKLYWQRSHTTPKNASQALHIPYIAYWNNLKLGQIYFNPDTTSKQSNKHRNCSTLGSQKSSVSSANNKCDTIISS
jgi:hypothetical protein